MYCKKCGKQLDSTATFCKYCGSLQASAISSHQPPSSAQATNERTDRTADVSEGEISRDEQKIIIRKHQIFFCNNEVLIDTLGSGFLSSLLVQDTLGKSVLICSNKRVYQRGKLFERNYQGRIIYSQGEKSVDLREITGIKYSIENPVWRLLPIALFLFLGTIAFALGQELDNNLGETLQIIAGFMVGTAIISLIIYAIKKPKYLEIHYPGGSIITNCNWYPKKNIRQFMINVSLQKDKIIASEHNQLLKD